MCAIFCSKAARDTTVTRLVNKRVKTPNPPPPPPAPKPEILNPSFVISVFGAGLGFRVPNLNALTFYGC